MSVKAIYDHFLWEQAQDEFNPKAVRVDKTALILETAHFIVMAECTKITKQCVDKVDTLFTKHLNHLKEQDEAKLTETAENFKKLVKAKKPRQIVTQLAADKNIFYDKYKISMLRLYREVQESGIFPSYEVVDRLVEEDLDRLYAKQLEMNMELFRNTLKKCNRKRKCYADALETFEDVVENIYDQAIKSGVYGEFVAYIGRARFGHEQSDTKRKALLSTLNEFADEEEEYSPFDFQGLYNEFTDAETRALELKLCDHKKANEIRRRIEKLHALAKRCISRGNRQMQNTCLRKLGRLWAKYYKKDMADVAQLTCPATIVRYALTDSNRLIVVNDDSIDILRAFARTYLYRGYANFIDHYTNINEKTFVNTQGQKDTYFDDCSLGPLNEVKSFLRDEQKNKSIMECNAMKEGKKKDKCFTVIVDQFKTFFDYIEKLIFKKGCRLLGYHVDIFEFIKDLRIPLHQPQSMLSYEHHESVSEGLVILYKYLFSSGGNSSQSAGATVSLPVGTSDDSLDNSSVDSSTQFSDGPAIETVTENVQNNYGLDEDDKQAKLRTQHLEAQQPEQHLNLRKPKTIMAIYENAMKRQPQEVFPHTINYDQTLLILEAAVVVVDKECDNIDSCLPKMSDLFNGHIKRMTDAGTPPTDTLKELKELLSTKDMKPIVARLKKDKARFYQDYQIDLPRLYVQVQESGILPSYEVVMKLVESDLDRMVVKELEVAMEYLRKELVKCQGDFECSQKAYEELKTKVEILYKQATNEGIYSEFTGYIGRAHFGLKQGKAKTDMATTFREFADFQERYADFNVFNLYNEIAFGETRARDNKSCDHKILNSIRKYLERMHKDSQVCLNLGIEKNIHDCFNILGQGWLRTYHDDMANIKKLDCKATVARYVMVDVNRIVMANQSSFIELLTEYAHSYLYHGYPEFDEYFKTIVKKTSDKRELGKYYDDCSAPILEKVKKFLTNKTNNRNIDKCAKEDETKRDDCFMAIVDRFRQFFDKVEQVIFDKECPLLEYHFEIFEMIKELRAPLHQPPGIKAPGLLEGFIQLYEVTNPIATNK